MEYRPGDTYHKLFTLASPTTAAASDADGGTTTSATFYRNLAADSAVTVTVTHIGTATYGVSCVIPATYADGDDCEVIATATVGGVLGLKSVEKFRVFVDYDGVAAGGGAGTITLANTTDQTDAAVVLVGGTGAGQRRMIVSQAGAVATVNRPWTTTPDATTRYSLGVPTTTTALASAATATATATATAAAVLATPAQKLATDSTGRVTVGSNADKAGYTVSTVTDKTGYALGSAGLDAIYAEAGFPLMNVVRGMARVLLGKSSGFGVLGGTAKFRDLNDTKDSLAVTTDSNGNRTGFATRDLT